MIMIAKYLDHDEVEVSMVIQTLMKMHKQNMIKEIIKTFKEYSVEKILLIIRCCNHN